jgi:hypothetical protein
MGAHDGSRYARFFTRAAAGTMLVPFAKLGAGTRGPAFGGSTAIEAPGVVLMDASYVNRPSPSTAGWWLPI